MHQSHPKIIAFSNISRSSWNDRNVETATHEADWSFRVAVVYAAFLSTLFITRVSFRVLQHDITFEIVTLLQIKFFASLIKKCVLHERK